MNRHPAHLPDERTFGQRAADRVAAGMGSWAFIITQTAIVACWIGLNVVAFIHHWDPFPFILLNLLFSTQAAYAAPVIMQSQNRQGEIDRAHAELAYNHISELLIINRQQLAHLAAILKRGESQHREVLSILHNLSEGDL